MKISIIIRARNEDQHIEKLLLGIRAQRERPHEVILVDSGSTDSTVDIVRRHGGKVVTIGKQEFTFGRALNIGCAAATGDICVFPSAHVYPVFDTWLEKLTAPFEDERVVLAYGRQTGNKTNKFSERQIFSRWFPRRSVCPQPTYFCNNANCAIRRSVWEKQPYDESLTGLEDLAWAKAVQSRGGWLAYVADAEIVHVHDETWEQVQNRYRREAIAMRRIDEHAKFTRFDFVKLLFRNVLTDARIAIAQRVFFAEIGSIVRFRWNQLLGTYRGYRDPPQISAQLRKRFYYPSRTHHESDTQLELERHIIDYDTLLSHQQSAEAAEPVSPPAESPAPSAVVHILRVDR